MAAPQLQQGGSQAAAVKVAEDGNALAAFNIRFRQQGEEKDAKERDAKAARKAAGKAALKKMLGERNERVATRKAANREAESAAEKDMLNALSGESWCRVVSLMDASAAAHGKDEGAAEKKGKASGGAASGSSTSDLAKSSGGVNDTLRLKDVRGGSGGARLRPCLTRQLLTHSLPSTALRKLTPRPQILIALKAKPL